MASRGPGQQPYAVTPERVFFGPWESVQEAQAALTQVGKMPWVVVG